MAEGEPTPTDYKDLCRDVCELVKEGTELVRRDIGMLREDIHEHDKQAKDILNQTVNTSGDIRSINATLLETTKVQQETAILLKQSQIAMAQEREDRKSQQDADRQERKEQSKLMVNLVKYVLVSLVGLVASIAGLKFL